jgi:hypothetical protein
LMKSGCAVGERVVVRESHADAVTELHDRDHK